MLLAPPEVMELPPPSRRETEADVVEELPWTGVFVWVFIRRDASRARAMRIR